MIQGISMLAKGNPYQKVGSIQAAQRAAQTTAVQQTQPTQQSDMQWKISGESTLPVQPIRPIGAATVSSAETMDPAQKLEQGADPVELAVRMRIQYTDNAEVALDEEKEFEFRLLGQEEEESFRLLGQKEEESFRLLGQEKESALAVEEEAADQNVQEAKEKKDTEDAQDIMEEEECQTCERRQYQDGSDDPGVSYKVPTQISKEAAAAAVRSHEMEHVVRERAAAEREDKKVISQSVTIHTGICPECGDVYVSGGTTRTTTMKKAEDYPQQNTAEWVKQGNNFSAIA